MEIEKKKPFKPRNDYQGIEVALTYYWRILRHTPFAPGIQCSRVI